MSVALSSCATTPTTPIRLPGLVLPDGGRIAYLWTSGVFYEGFGNLHDFATVTRIGGVKTPDRFVPWIGNPPFVSWLVEIPAGRLEIEIIYEEQTVICYQSCLVMEQTRYDLVLSAEPGHMYAPFVSDKCSRDWFWVEDLGEFIAGSTTQRRTRYIWSDLSRQVVAGQAPQKSSCEQSQKVLETDRR